MVFDRNENKQVIALLGAGSMGCVIVKRIAAGKKIFLGDISEKKLEQVKKEFQYCGYDVETMVVDASDKESLEAYAAKAAELGDVMYFDCVHKDRKIQSSCAIGKEWGLYYEDAATSDLLPFPRLPAGISPAR